MQDSVPSPNLGFVCDMNSVFGEPVCTDQSFHGEHEGKKYCVLHFPGTEKKELFREAFEKKLAVNDYNFAGVWFPDVVSLDEFDFHGRVSFQRAIFNAAASFQRTTFNDHAQFQRAIFRERVSFGFAKFHGAADFVRVTFEKAAIFTRAEFVRCPENIDQNRIATDVRFMSAKFNGRADFIHATLRTANFRFTTFSGVADFRWAKSDQLDFGSGTFENYLRFAGPLHGSVGTNLGSMNLEFAAIGHQGRVSFHRLVLYPHWFVNVDAREFEFNEVIWDWSRLKKDFENVVGDKLALTGASFGRACRNLAVNAEENHRFEEASKFRYLAMDVHRRERLRGFAFWQLSWWYWLASGFGERVLQAFLVLLAIWFLAGLLYTRVGFLQPQSGPAQQTNGSIEKVERVAPLEKLSRALTYSAAVMTFQRPEPKPASIAAQTVVLLETILGPLQAALLALAIRRKFMR